MVKIVNVAKQFIKKHRLLLAFFRGIKSFLHRLNFLMSALKKMLFKVLDKNSDLLLINIGGGNFVRRKWKVLDNPMPSGSYYDYNNIFIDYSFDLTSGKSLPFLDNSVSLFYSSHTFEHVPQEYCQDIFDDIFRSLKKGGAIRFTMPDFDLVYNAFGKRDAEIFEMYPHNNLEDRFLRFFSTYFINNISLKEFQSNYNNMSREEFADFYTKKIPRSSQSVHPENHINWWNYDKLEKMLVKSGFSEVYRSHEQGSRFEEMRGGKGCSGFDTTHPEISLFVEAIK